MSTITSSAPETWPAPSGHWRWRKATQSIVGRDQSKAAELAKTLGGNATTGEFGVVPAGDIVIVALRYANVVPVVTQYGDALADKVIVDICNPFNSTAAGSTSPTAPRSPRTSRRRPRPAPAW